MTLGKVLSLIVTVLLLVTPMMATCIGPAVADGTIGWGRLHEVTDPEDYYIDNIGNANGYLDKGTVTAIYEDSLYAVWETTERKKGGSMLYVRSMEEDVWGSIKTLAGAEDGVIDTQPAVAAYKGGLYVVWQRASGDDTEILCKVLELGKWSSCPEVSGEADYGIDSDPSLAVYDGRLWAAWVTRSSVTGKDPGGGDIAVRSFDGQGWSENIGIVNPTPANGMDSGPKLAAVDDRLVVVWATKDDDISMDTDLDIVLRSYDGQDWSDIIEVTGNDGAEDDDTEVSLAVLDGVLHILWQSAGDRAQETDIHHATWDGSKLSRTRNVVPDDNQAADEHPSAAVFDGRVFVAWNSNDLDFTVGGDDDIVVSVLEEDGWSWPEEVTGDDMTEAHEGHSHRVAAQDKYPVLATLGDALYCFWEQDDQRSAVMDPGDIKYKRHPPEEQLADKFLVALGLLVVLVILLVVLFGFMGRRRTPGERRYMDAKERKELRRMAMSKAGGRKGGRKGRGKRR